MWTIARAEGEDGEEFSETYYACAPPKGRKLHLAASYSYLTCGGSVLQLQVAGSYAAIVESGGCQYGSTTTVHVLDARSGRTASVTVTQGEGGPSDLLHLGSPVGMGAKSLVLDNHGDVAWLGKSAEQKDGPPSLTVLYVHDGQGTRRLAAAPSITGLAFRGPQLIWQEGPVTQAAPR